MTRRRHYKQIGTPQPDAPLGITVLATLKCSEAEFQALIAQMVAAGWTHVRSHYPVRWIKLTGTMALAERTFGVQLYHARIENHNNVLQYRGTITVPPAWDASIHSVLGLDHRPVAHRHICKPVGLCASAPEDGFWPPEISDLYGLPTGNGHGVRIAILQLGGQYQPCALKWYLECQYLPMPFVSVVGAEHQTKTADETEEVMLDIEVIAALVPRASITIYFEKNHHAGYVDAFAQATADGNDIVSVSWGAPESTWSESDKLAVAHVTYLMATQGIVICCASGDEGAYYGCPELEVDYPSSCPYILGVGGTTVLNDDLSPDPAERVWNNDPATAATGGGHSRLFARPYYQDHVPLSTCRMVPDVAAMADPGYKIRTLSEWSVIGGTSAAAPLWAAIFARIQQHRHARIGFAHAKLYGLPDGSLRPITLGNNGFYDAGVPYNMCTGLGTPPNNLLALFP